MSTPEEFAQLKLSFIDPLQHHYEVIRPVVLLGETISARSRQTGVERSQISEKAQRFITNGMLALADQRLEHAGRTSHDYPQPVANHILYLKQLYPPIHYHEIVRILQRKFGYATNHSTVKRFVERHPMPVQLELNWTYFHDFENAYLARWTVVRMWAEGWSKKSIAGCLHLSRKHVHDLITAFQHDGFAGLEDQRSRPPAHPDNQLSLPFMSEVLELQHDYPRAGRIRIHALLQKQYQQQGRDESLPSERSVGRAMAINRLFHGAPDPVASEPPHKKPERDGNGLPYQPVYRHQYWFIDIRYLRQFGKQWSYSLCILEGYSRKILAGMASEYQDEVAILQLLTAALGEYGCPGGIVSDNGAVFTAHAYCGLLETLGIGACYIDKGEPWQNLIEAQFKVQLRLADAQFERAASAVELHVYHAAFVETFNTTAHWAHRERADGLRTPVDVLAWIRGRRVGPDELREAVRQVQVERSVDQHGYVSIQRFSLYAERGLARQRVSIWLYDGRLQIAHQGTLVARYAYASDRKSKRIKKVQQPVLYRTIYASPQLEMWELDDEQWRKVIEREPRQRRRSAAKLGEQAEQLSLWLLVLLTVLLAPSGEKKR